LSRYPIAIISYYPKYFALIAHFEQHYGFWFRIASKESHITPGGILHPVWEPLN